MKYPVVWIEYHGWLFRNIPPITPRGVRSMAIFQTDEDRRVYWQFLAEETERFGVEILVCAFEPDAGCNRQEGLGLSTVPFFFSQGAEQEGPPTERSAMGKLSEEAGRIFDGATRAKDQAIRQMTRTGRPAGNAAFVDLVERLTDRHLSKSNLARPVTKDKLYGIMSPEFAA